MSKKIILHIGSPKCGSTFLQRVLLNNKDTLLKYGVLYPHGGNEHPGNAGDIVNLSQAQFNRYFEQASTLFLSHEDLLAGPGLAIPLSKYAKAAGVEIQVLAFLRPFSSFVYGDYSQLMKQNFDRYLATRQPYDGKSFQEIAQRRSKKLDPASNFGAWERVIPNMRVRVESHKNIKPVVQSLLADANIDWAQTDWRMPHAQTNPSLRTVDCDRIAAAIRNSKRSDDEITTLFRAAFHLTRLPDRGKSLRRKMWLEGLFKAQNQALLTDYNYDNRAKLDLFPTRLRSLWQRISA